MAGPDDPRRSRPEDEDLFEDLDQFFAPLGDADWPEEAGAAEQADTSGRDAPPPSPDTPTPPAGEQTPGDDWNVDIDVPDEADLLTPRRREEPPSEVVAAEEPAAPDESVEPSPPEAPEVEEELAWDEMRAEALGTAARETGDDELGEGIAVEDAPAPPASGVVPPEGPAEEREPGEAPAGEAPADQAAGDLEEDLLGEPTLSAEDLFEEPVPAEPVDALGAGEEAPTEDRPEPAAIEAAAEHFATGLRGSPDEVERELLADLEAPEDETVTVEAGAPTTPAPTPEPTPPTWQEGGAPIDEVVEERAPAGVAGGRNLVAASLSGIVLALAVIVLLVIDKGPFAVFASIVILLGQAELYAVMRTRRLQPATLLGLVCGAVILAGAYLHGAAALPFGLVLLAGLSVLWYMAAPQVARKNVTVNVAATVLGAVYVPFLAGFTLLLLAFPGDLGRNVFLVVLGLTVLYDVIAYAVGTLWGNRPLAPTVSPNKSWEGVIGATLGVLIVALAIVPAVEPFTPSRAVGLALVIALVAPLGDLVESALKRDLGVKDMGTILPGHGGILDRIDAILFTAPAAYYFLQLTF
jgi:phosphatidate cytidylyltransferase